MTPVSLAQNSVLKKALSDLSPYIWQTAAFSFVINLLILAPSWYMLEVYDRVLNSHNHRTLFMLTILIIAIYMLLEVLEWVRSRIMYQAVGPFDVSLRDQVFNSIFQAKLRQEPGGSAQAISDLKTIQEAIASPALLALIDTPFALLTLGIIFLIDPYLGWFALGVAIILGAIALFNQHKVEPTLAIANRHAIAAQSYASGTIRNAQVIEAMGMLGRIHHKWLGMQHEFLQAHAEASDHAGVSASLSRLMQTVQASLILGLGCWLAITGVLDMGGSLMIVASILGARALAPLVQIVGHWRIIMNTQDSIKRLDSFLKLYPVAKPSMQLPAPLGNLSVEAVVAGPPNSQIPILKGIRFRLAAGDSLAIVGPSASGKTTLARLITGIWPTMSGKVRLDGVDMYSWKKNELGPYVGYLPQSVELFDGTIAENIARFGEIDIQKVKDAAQIVGLDNFIESIKDGYEARIGDEGAFLSGGQRQRIALARAIYGIPKFIVLDEPNSSLDEEGDYALLRTLQFMKSQGTTTIVITHRPQISAILDYMMVLVDGQIQSFGPRDEVLKALNQKGSSTAQPQAGMEGVA